MLCPCLAPLEQALIDAGIRETYRGQAWSHNCREWVYFDCYLDRSAIRARLSLPEHIIDHEHCGTHDGQESGFCCALHQDGIMGVHERNKQGKTVIA